MVGSPTQANSSLRLETALGTDALILLEADGSEGLSEPFEIVLAAETSYEGLGLAALVGTSATVTLVGGDGTERPINGIVWSVRHAGSDCRLVLRPWLSLLGTASNNRIFQDMSATEIVTQVFDDAGFSDYRLSLTGLPPSHSYCVQFGETDLDFVSRLLEAEGLGYFFEHEDGVHRLVIFDDISALATLPGGAVPFLPVPAPSTFIEDRRIEGLAACNLVTAGKVALRDYNFEQPSKTLEVSIGDGARGPYRYPGHHMSTDAGQTLARIRLEALEAEGAVVEGSTPWRSVRTGTRFTLSDHPDSTLDGDYLLRSVAFHAVRREYTARFEAQRTDLPWRPAQHTPRPRMAGPQTARVVGKAGEEIWTDQYGRIKVQFPWDRDGNDDENSSCWIRVAQVWAAAGWGAMVLPRIGQEVVVSFIDGDPDRPLVTGVVYNAENTVPYPLPAEQTKTTLKSDTSKGGGGSNELRFEDKAGAEEVYLHAQKDMTVSVENDRTTTVGHDQTVTITNARTVTVSEGDDSLTVAKGARSVTVAEGDETHTVGGTRTLNVTGDETRSNEANVVQTIKGDATLTVEGALTISVTGNLTIETSGALNLKSAGAFSIAAGGAFSLSAGSSASIAAGSSVDLTAGASVSVTGSSSATISGGGMLTLTGGIVSIN